MSLSVTLIILSLRFKNGKGPIPKETTFCPGVLSVTGINFASRMIIGYFCNICKSADM